MSQPITVCPISVYIYGVICTELAVYDRIPGAEIFAIRSREKAPTANPSEGERGDAKRVLRTATEDEVKQLAAAPNLLQGRTDENGFSCLDEPNYQGELLDIYVCLNSVPGPKDEIRPLPARVCLFIGTYAPERAGNAWLLKLFIPSVIWCNLKRLADVWTVAGRVATCDTDQPLGNVTVIARDVDFIQSDLLGEGVTNGLGIFRIDYLGNAFRKGTIIDIELFGGPDIYFEVQDSGGTTLLAEDASAGRQPGRCDSGPCTCVRLCVDLPDGNTDDTLPSAWIRVGTAFKIPDSPAALNDFDADGYAGAAKFVLTGAPAMRGGVPRKTAGGDPIEYRFLVGNTTAANTAAPLGAGIFTRIVGAGPVADKNLFSTTLMGDLWRVVSLSPFVTETVTIVAVQSDLSADGWLNINKVIENRFVEAGRNPLDIPLFSWIPNGNLMLIDTGALPTAANVPDGVAGAGQPVPVVNYIPIEKMSLRFETRNATTLAPLSGSGKVLNSMIVNNNPIFLKVAMKEHIDGGDACGVIHGSAHVAYTVYHPHLQSADILIYSNDLSYLHHLNDPEPPGVPPARLPLSGNTNPAIVSINRSDLNLPVPMHKCTYIVILSAQSRRHTGDSQVSTEQPPAIAFFFEP
jgi:hypothetical protein